MMWAVYLGIGLFLLNGKVAAGCSRAESSSGRVFANLPYSISELRAVVRRNVVATHPSHSYLRLQRVSDGGERGRSTNRLEAGSEGSAFQLW